MTDEKVFYHKEDIVKILADLNMIVVSLDRIGAEYSEYDGRKSEEQLNALLANFVFGWSVDRKLAKARKILDTGFSRKLGEDELDELERKFRDLQYWSIKNPKPIKKRK
ncbi:MAG: hypothetical protein ABI686_05715 [Acidobacteriota bacterium]